MISVKHPQDWLLNEKPSGCELHLELVLAWVVIFFLEYTLWISLNSILFEFYTLWILYSLNSIQLIQIFSYIPFYPIHSDSKKNQWSVIIEWSGTITVIKTPIIIIYIYTLYIYTLYIYTHYIYTHVYIHIIYIYTCIYIYIYMYIYIYIIHQHSVSKKCHQPSLPRSPSLSDPGIRCEARTPRPPSPQFQTPSDGQKSQK